MKRNRIQLCLIRLLAGGLLAGCTAGPVEEIVPEESRPVAISFGKPDLGVPELLTRAGEEVTPAPTSLPAGTTIRIGAYFIGNVGGKLREASFSTEEPSFEATYVVEADGTLTPCRVDGNGKQITGEAKGLIVRGGVYDFYAVSPARRLVKDTDNNYKITDIPHKEDVMTSFARRVAVTKEARQVTLNTFSRKCALLVFHVAPSPDNVLPFRKLAGTRLEINRVSSSGACLITEENACIIPTGGSEDIGAQVVFTEEEFEPIESAPDTLTKTKGIILPKNSRSFDVGIEVERDDETAGLNATINEAVCFEEGKRYIFTLEVKNNECRLLMTVQNWTEYSFSDSNVGGPDRPSSSDPDINPGIGTTIVVAGWREISWTGNVGG